MTPDWIEHGSLTEDIDVLCNDAGKCGRSYSRRFVHTSLPGRVVDVVAYPSKTEIDDPNMPDGKNSMVTIMFKVLMTLCTDTSDPNGTATWGAVTYPDLPEGWDHAYPLIPAAEGAARALVTMITPDNIIWQGETIA